MLQIAPIWVPFTAGASAAVPGRRLVMLGAGDGAVELPDNTFESILIGASQREDVAAGERLDVAVSGIAEVEYGGPVVRAARVTSDSVGRAVATTYEARNHLVHATGAAANTDIDVANITLQDEIEGVVATDGTSPGLVAITSAGHIQCTLSTTGKHLIVLWRRKMRVAGIALESRASGEFGPILLTPGAIET